MFSTRMHNGAVKSIPGRDSGEETGLWGSRFLAYGPLSEKLGQTVVVENKAGAGGNIAHQLTANGPTDGSLLLFGSIGPLAIAPHMMKLPYDPFLDLAPITGAVYFPSVLVVNAEKGPKTLAEFIARLRRSPLIESVSPHHSDDRVKMARPMR